MEHIMKEITTKLLIDDLSSDLQKAKSARIGYIIIAIVMSICINSKNELTILSLIITLITSIIIYTILYTAFTAKFKTAITCINQKQFYIRKEKIRDVQHYSTYRQKKHQHYHYQKVIFTNNDDIQFSEDQIDQKMRQFLNSFSVGQEYYLVYTKSNRGNKLIKYYLTDDYELYGYSLSVGETIDGKLIL